VNTDRDESRSRARIDSWRAGVANVIGEPVRAINVFTRPGALERFSLKKRRAGKRLAPGFPVHVVAAVTVSRQLVFVDAPYGPTRPGGVVWSGPLASITITSPADGSSITVGAPSGPIATLEPTFGTSGKIARLLRAEFDAAVHALE
jgi:hypothetical protein